jgi:hypothetical protein
MLTLIDIGASRSLIRRDVAVKVLNGLGRPAVFQRGGDVLTSLTGHGLEVVGQVELLVQPVGLVLFNVVQAMSHECIVGMDQLKRHGYSLMDRPVGKFTWGRAEYLLDEKPWIGHEISEVDDHPVRKVVQEYQDLFSEEGTLRESSLPGIQVETEPGRVVNCKPYRTSLNKRHIVDTEIDNMLKMGIIRPSNSEWASGITLVPKKDGSTRCCVAVEQCDSEGQVPPTPYSGYI